MGQLSGKVAVVVGATKKSGMGFSAAKALASNGADVIVTGLTEPRPDLDFRNVYSANSDEGELEERANELTALGVRSLALPVDITCETQIQSCRDIILSEFERIDILFNNAGTAAGVGSFLELPESAWDLSYQVNLKGTALFSKAVLPSMIELGGGSIINNSSVWAQKVAPFSAAYSSTKAAVIALTKVIATEFGEHNIRCNAICPGTILSDMHQVDLALYRDDGFSEHEANISMAKDVAARRLGTADDIGPVVAFLASDAASYINGCAIAVDGGVIVGL